MVRRDSFKAVREEVRRGYHSYSPGARKGWFGEPERHAQAARGVKTARAIQAKSKPSTVRDREVMKRANEEMDRILDLQDKFVSRQPTFEEQERMTKMLDSIIEQLATVNLATLWINVEQAIMDIDGAWSTKDERTRIVTLEVARERLHYVILHHKEKMLQNTGRQ